MTPRPLPPEQIKTPRGIGINEGEGGARVHTKAGELRMSAQLRAAGPSYPDELDEAMADMARRRGPRVLRRFVRRGDKLVEVESVVRETR